MHLISLVNPFFFFFLKCQIIVHEMITIDKIFDVSFLYIIYSKDLNPFMGE